MFCKWSQHLNISYGTQDAYRSLWVSASWVPSRILLSHSPLFSLRGVCSPLYQAFFSPVICSLCCMTTTALPQTSGHGAELSNVPLCGALRAFHWQQISIWGEDLFLVFFLAFKERSPRSNWGHVLRSPFPAESALWARSHTQREKKRRKKFNNWHRRRRCMMLIKRQRSTAQQTAAQLQRLTIQCIYSRFLSVEPYVAVTAVPRRLRALSELSPLLCGVFHLG